MARRHFIPQGAVLVYTEWIVGIVLFTGVDTKLSMHGGVEVETYFFLTLTLIPTITLRIIEGARAAGMANRAENDAFKVFFHRIGLGYELRLQIVFPLYLYQR